MNNKYWLPNDVTLLPGQSSDFTKETKLLFLDKTHGEFLSSFKALQLANNSTHPKAVQLRREETNKQRYGGVNPHCSKDVVEKAQRTMEEKYGVKHALQNKDLLSKSKTTLLEHYNVQNPMHSYVIKTKMKETIREKYNVDNVAQSPDVQQKIQATSIKKYGVKNPSQSPEIIEKILQNKSLKTSKGENEVRSFIENELRLSTKVGYIGGSSPKQLDIKLTDRPIAIEYNGSYWHSEANPKITKSYHFNKFKACQTNNIKLIQVFDFEWENRRQQVQSFLRSALGCNEVKLNARSLTLQKHVKNDNIIKEFLNEWHILGGSLNFECAYSLNHPEHGIVSVITIGKHHRNNQEWVLSRYCGKGNVTVRGGLTKLVTEALRSYNVLSTWIDLRWSNGEAWVNNGWKVVCQLKPDYFYYNINNNQIVSKQKRKKSNVNTAVDETEHEHALKDGLKRIYDCGKLKLQISL